jgi:adenylyl-sulfate kinase
MEMTQKGFTVWFTGLSGAGKSTLANLLFEELKSGRGLKVERLDGDEVRQNLSKGLGFSKEDRDTNIRRIGYVCNLLTRNEVIAIAAAISPYRAIRDENRALIGGERFVEVHVHVPLAVAIQRDTKGLYEKAIRGEIKEFTGVSDPYEPPLAPEIYIDSAQETPAQSFNRIMNYLKGCGLLEPDGHRAG